MKLSRMLAWSAAILTLIAAAGLPSGVSRAPTAYAVEADLGVFGFTESDWGDGGNPVDAYTVFAEEGADFWVRFDGGETSLVEIVFTSTLTIAETEEYVRNGLLPGDAELSVEYDEVLVADGDPRLHVQLYDSRSLADFSPDSLGYILVTYVLDGAGSDTSRVSLSTGRAGF